MQGLYSSVAKELTAVKPPITYLWKGVPTATTVQSGERSDTSRKIEGYIHKIAPEIAIDSTTTTDTNLKR